MENKLVEIQNILFDQMKKLNNEHLDLNELNIEISRSNAISTSAVVFVKTVNLGIRLLETTNNNSIVRDELNKKLGM